MNADTSRLELDLESSIGCCPRDTSGAKQYMLCLLSHQQVIPAIGQVLVTPCVCLGQMSKSQTSTLQVQGMGTSKQTDRVHLSCLMVLHHPESGISLCMQHASNLTEWPAPQIFRQAGG